MICEKIKILAIETTGKYGSAAIIDDESRIYSAETHDENDHLKEITDTIDKTLKEAGCDKRELTHIAASVGPGSFTGIRIGVTAARTLAQMLGLPCVAVSSLEGLAERALDEAVSKGVLYIVPIINARRHQTYGCIYEVQFTSDMEHIAASSVADEKQYMIEELLAEIRAVIAKEEQEAASGPSVLFTGDGADAYADIIENELPAGSYIIADEDRRYQHAEAVARIALRRAEAGRIVSYEDLTPEYMRLAEAEQRLKDGTLSDKIKMLTR